MARRNNISRADQLLSGRAYAPNAPFSGSIPGILRSHLMVVRWGAGSLQGFTAPTAAATNNICAAQAISGAVNANINGSLASGGVATLDVPRSLQMASSNAGDTTQTVTVRGTDTVGRAVTETRTLNGTTAVNFQKAFKTVTRVSVSAAMTGNLTVGTNNRLGVPARIRVGDVLLLKVNDAVPEAGTIVAGDTATPTATTGDPCGTIQPTTAPNGTNVYTALINVEDASENAYGTQFSS